MIPRRLPQILIAEHPGRRPTGPAILFFHHGHAFGKTTRNRKNERHCHVGCVFGQNTGRVGHSDIARIGGVHIDIVDTIAEIRHELKIFSRLRQHMGIDSIRHGGNQHIGHFHRLNQFRLAHGLVFNIQARVEQLAHSGFHSIGELAGYDYNRLSFCHRFALFMPHSIT